MDFGFATDLLVERPAGRGGGRGYRDQGMRLAGMWAHEALRIAGHRARFGTDTDHRTIPHEVGWIESAVHLTKGCYRGQETVARVHNLGHPPRRLVLLHLDGSEDRLPAARRAGAARRHGRRVRRLIGAALRTGPDRARALIKRTVPVDGDARSRRHQRRAGSHRRARRRRQRQDHARPAARRPLTRCGRLAADSDEPAGIRAQQE